MTDDTANGIDGGCLCGRVRYRLGPAPGPALGPTGVTASICHCATCRRAAGAQSVAWATVPAKAFAWTGAAPAAHVSSPGVVRTHCAACGTSLTYQCEADWIDVTVASLDDPEAIPPAAEIWLAHRLSWEPVDPARPAFPRGPADAA